MKARFVESRSFLQQRFRHDSHKFSGTNNSEDVLHRLKQDHEFRQKIDQDLLQNRPQHHLEEEKDVDEPPAQIMQEEQKIGLEYAAQAVAVPLPGIIAAPILHFDQ